MTAAPSLLFLPVSGPGGSGELYRCLALARAAQRRWGAPRIHFILNRRARYAGEFPFDATLIDTSPTYSLREVTSCMERLRPDAAIFDNAGGLNHFRAARRIGARVVFISSRFKPRWKGFQPRRMRVVDQHWVVHPEFLGAGLSWREIMMRRLVPRHETVTLPAVFEPPEPARGQALLARFGVRPREYIVLCPGGSGKFEGQRDAVAVFRAAAAQLATRCQQRVALVGAAVENAAADAGVLTVPPLPNGELMDLISSAAIAVINGGSLLGQTLALGCAAVAAPIAADQWSRIYTCARRGLIVASELTAESIAENTAQLAADAGRRDAIRAAVARLGLRNGSEVAIPALARLLARAAAHA